MEALVQPGMVSDTPSDTRNNEEDRSVTPEKDYFIARDGIRYAGTHLIIDLWGATNLDDPAHIDAVLREGALATGATILAYSESESSSGLGSDELTYSYVAVPVDDATLVLGMSTQRPLLAVLNRQGQ